MSLHLPTRRVATTIGTHGLPTVSSEKGKKKCHNTNALARAARSAKSSPCPDRLLPITQRRNAFFGGFFGKKNQKKEKPVAKQLDTYQTQKKLLGRLTDRQQGESIFDDDTQGGKTRKVVRKETEEERVLAAMKPSAMREHNIRSTDPDPRWRVRWQKKQIMKTIRSDRGPTREEIIRREERRMRSSSPPLPTSYKKLMHLARQVAGKTVEDALVQMRFSKKKMAREMRVQIEEARDDAILQRGMGLAKPNGQLLKQPKKIQTKDGKWLDITDPSRLYIDEAWVTKGPWRGAHVEYRARARMNVIWKPTAREFSSLTLLLPFFFFRFPFRD